MAAETHPGSNKRGSYGPFRTLLATQSWRIAQFGYYLSQYASLGSHKELCDLKGWATFQKYFGPILTCLNFDTASFISQNFPATYELLPRYDFYSILVGGIAKRGEPFLETWNRLKNSVLVSETKDLWDTLLAKPTTPVRSFAINGSGHKTLLDLTEDPDHNNCLIPGFDGKGDGTVPVISLGAASVVPNTKFFWVNAEHSDVPNTAIVTQKIIEILNGSDDPSIVPGSFQSTAFDVKVTRVYSCSPVRMQIIDAQGNMTGLDDEGNLKENINDSDFFVFPENEGAFLPGNVPLQVALKATDSGTFSLTFDFFGDANALIQSAKFQDVPISISSRAQLTLNPGGFSQTLAVDVDGNGTTDYFVQSNQPPPPGSFASVLMDIIGTFNLPHGIDTDLTSVLRAALDAIQLGNKIAARNQFASLQHKASAQRGKSLTSQQADLIIRLAGLAIRLLE